MVDSVNVYLRKSIKKLFEGIRPFGKIAEYEQNKPNVLAFCYTGDKYQDGNMVIFNLKSKQLLRIYI